MSKEPLPVYSVPSPRRSPSKRTLLVALAAVAGAAWLYIAHNGGQLSTGDARVYFSEHVKIEAKMAWGFDSKYEERLRRNCAKLNLVYPAGLLDPKYMSLFCTGTIRNDGPRRLTKLGFHFVLLDDIGRTIAEDDYLHLTDEGQPTSMEVLEKPLQPGETATFESMIYPNVPSRGWAGKWRIEVNDVQVTAY